MSARRFTLALVAVLGIAPRTQAQARGGTESNLALGASSQGIAVGGAFAAAVGDASALYWNPGRLAGLERGSALVSHAPIGFGGAAQTFAGAAYPALGAGTFGLGFLRLASGGIDAYDAESRPQGQIEFAETAVLLGYAHRLAVRDLGALELGATAKAVTQSLGPWSSTGTGLDLGAAFAPRRLPSASFALVWRDAIAPRVRLDQDADVVPSMLHLAGTWRAWRSRRAELTVHGGVDRSGAIGWSPRAGLEATYRSRLHVRAGASRQGVAFGVGITLQRTGLDYALLERESAATQPVTARAEWGHSLDERTALRTAAREAELRAHLQDRVERRAEAAHAAFDRGDYATALEEWKFVAGLDPTDERAERGLAAAGAELASQQARTLADREHAAARAAQFELGVKYYGRSEYALAREIWAALAAADPDNAEVQRYLAKSSEALRAQIAAQADEARRLEARRDWVNALAAWSRVHAADGGHAEAQAALGRCRAALERPAPRVERASGDRTPPPRTSPAADVFRDAVSAYAGGDVARAVTLLQRARSLDPSHSEAARLLAKAERQLQPLGPEDRARVRELYLRGMSFFTANEFEKAIVEWTKILDLEPGNQSVYQNIREARARLRALQP